MAYTFAQKSLLALAPTPVSWILRSLASTWRQVELGHADLSPRRCGERRFIYVYWHEYILSLVGSYRDHPIHALASHSYDGELISSLLRKLGYPPPARGSSSRGGYGAIKELVDLLGQGNHVAMTVDGPRGPRRQAQAGALKVAQLSGREVVPVGFASSSKLRLRSWDRTLLPLPLSRAAFYFEEPIKVGEGEAAVEAAHKLMQEKLDFATGEAVAHLEGAS